jgi:predicted MFS family arabinose efflux permease
VNGPQLPRGPGGGRGWMIRGPRGPFRWTAFVLAVTSFAAAVPTPLYPAYEARFHFSAGVLGLAFAAYTPGVFLTLFFVAPRAERIGRRKLLYLSMALTVLGAVVFALATNVLWLAVGRAIAGLAVGAATSVATAAMSDLEPFRDQHHVARVAVASNFGGFAIGVLASGFLVEFVPLAFRLVYVLPIVASAIGTLAVRVTPETATLAGAASGAQVQRIAVPAAIRRPFWVAVGGLAACYSIYGLFAALAPSYVRIGLRIDSPLAAATVVALVFGTAALVQLATSQVRDRRALLLGFPLMIGTLLALVVVLPLEQWIPLVLVATALGASVGLTFMGSVTLVDRIAPESMRGEILAGFYSAGYLALAVPTIGVAEASERIGLTGAGVLFGIVLAVAVGVLYVAIYRTPTPPGGGGRPRGADNPP